MTAQPPIPAMPPMKAAQASAAPAAVSPPPVPVRAGRLKQIASYAAGGGLILVLLILFFELIARPGLRPSDLMSMVEARVELGVMNQKMGHAPGEHVLNEAQYQSIIAQAQRAGAAKAEIVFQRDLAVVQANKERVVSAYATLYQRTNIIAQAGVQMEAQAQQFRQRLIEQTNGGRAMVINILDGLCALGDDDSCEKARQARTGMIEESSSLTEGQLAQKVRELMAGIDDPATLVAREDQRQRGAPTLDR